MRDRTGPCMLMMQPVTGKMYKLWPRESRVFILRKQTTGHHYWEEISPERFAQDMECRHAVNLLTLPETLLDPGAVSAPEKDLATQIHDEEGDEGGDE